MFVDGRPTALHCLRSLRLDHQGRLWEADGGLGFASAERCSSRRLTRLNLDVRTRALRKGAEGAVLQKTNNSFTDPALFHAPDASDAVASPARLATLTRTGLLDSTPQDVFDRLTRAAAHAVLAPIAIVSLVDETRLVFAGAHGL